MNVVCAWCASEGKVASLGEKAPFDDESLTHGICAAHFMRMTKGSQWCLRDSVYDTCN
jgi:hypothetical protein